MNSFPVFSNFRISKFKIIQHATFFDSTVSTTMIFYRRCNIGIKNYNDKTLLENFVL